jgi:hypothetical protein
MKNRIAISFQGNDCLRIIPMPAKNGNAEIKFHFFDNSFKIRKFDFNNEIGGLIYIPRDHGQAEHELSYHSANEYPPTPVLLPKHKNNNRRTAISGKIINLALGKIIVPIPICRITSNIAPQKRYQPKDQHSLIELTDRYNTSDIYMADKDYNFEEMAEKYPMIVNFLFPITTMDFLVYGSGMSVEPIFNKMFENNEPIVALQTTRVGNYHFFQGLINYSKPMLLECIPNKSIAKLILLNFSTTLTIWIYWQQRILHTN